MKRGNAKLAATLSATILLLSTCKPVQAPPGGSADAPATAYSGDPRCHAQGDRSRPGGAAQIPSGVVAVPWKGGNPENMPELARLNEGVTMEQLNEALAQPDPMAALPLVTLLGNTSASADGQVIYDLQPGAYVAVLFVPDGPPQVIPVTAGSPAAPQRPLPMSPSRWWTSTSPCQTRSRPARRSGRSTMRASSGTRWASSSSTKA